MTLTFVLDCLAIFTGLASAYFWLRSATVEVPTTSGRLKNISLGETSQVQHQLALALQKQAGLSKLGAATAAATVFLQTIASLKL